METSTKQEIRTELEAYLAEHKMSAAAFSAKSGVSQSYISQIREGKFVTDNGVEIKEGYFINIAKAMGLQVDKSYWSLVMTREFKLAVGELENAQRNTLCRTIIMPPGFGKSHSLEKFDIRFPHHNYTVVIHAAMTLRDVIEELTEMMKLPMTGNVSRKIREVIIKVRDLKKAGHKVTIKFDECENMNPQTFRAIKGLWDGLYKDKHCSLVLVGTPQLLQMLESARKRDVSGAPQLYRRLKAGIRIIPVDLQAGLTLFFNQLGITDVALQKRLRALCENYGELHDFLEPAIRMADERGEELTDAFFARMYNL